LQIPASSHYQVDELREQLLPLLARTTAPVDDLLPGERREPTFSPLLLDGVDLGTSHPGAAREPQVPAPQAGEAMPVLMEENPFLDPDEEEPRETIPHCPRCAAPLVAREARKGPHAGRLFLACSRFPECRYAAPQESVKH